MTELERTVMQQALEALEMYRPLSLPIKLLSQDKTREEAITALREALKENEMAKIEGINMLDRFTSAEQAEQKPVGRWNWNEAKFEWLTKFDYHKHHMTPLYAAPQPVKQEPVGYFSYDEHHDIWEELISTDAPGATPLYAAPVRTKDLTDDEICEAAGMDDVNAWFVQTSRAVIAADREKNK